MDACTVDLDGAWGDLDGMTRIDARAWGPRLRYAAPAEDLHAFGQWVAQQLRPWPGLLVYGSGDFHHLSAVFLARALEHATRDRPAPTRAGADHPDDVEVVVFDNHPDWDRRPPRWGCGGWVNRVLEMPGVAAVTVWGCGNFELDWPHRLFRNRRALAQRRLRVFPWRERISPSAARLFGAIDRPTWRESFAQFAANLAQRPVYLTVDLDCLRPDQASTNWEPGLFTTDDLVFAIAAIRRTARVIGADLCGAWSPPRYARWTQRLLARIDRPKVPSNGRERNRATLAALLPVLGPGIPNPG